MKQPFKLPQPALEPLSFKVGDTFVFEYRSHGSVGFGAAHHLHSPFVCELLEDEVIYHNPRHVEQGLCGGDGGLGRFVFRCLAPGSTYLTCERWYRGKIEASFRYEIRVEA